MKQCPYCGNELPDDDTIYCLQCDHIIDDDFLLRQEIKKEVDKMHSGGKKANARKNSAPASAPGGRRDRDNYVPRTYYEEKKSYANIILIAIVVILILYMLFR